MISWLLASLQLNPQPGKGVVCLSVRSVPDFSPEFPRYDAQHAFSWLHLCNYSDTREIVTLLLAAFYIKTNFMAKLALPFFPDMCYILSIVLGF
jgi:hypothetical protein